MKKAPAASEGYRGSVYCDALPLRVTHRRTSERRRPHRNAENYTLKPMIGQ